MARTSTNKAAGPHQKRDTVPYASQDDESDKNEDKPNDQENDDNNQVETEDKEEVNEESDEDNDKELNNDNEEDDEITNKLQTKECRTETIDSDSDDIEDNTSEPKKKNPTEISVASGKNDHLTVSITSSLKSTETTLKQENEKKRKLGHYVCQESHRKRRMKIKTEAYRLINSDLVASESEAELEDKELKDEQPGRF